jgi:hypothetical protein
MVRVDVPPTADRSYPVELLLCGHHFRTSQQTLAAAGAMGTNMQDGVTRPVSELALL